MPSEDKVKAAEVWNESSLKLQQMINDHPASPEQQDQVSNDGAKNTHTMQNLYFFFFVSVTVCIMQFEGLNVEVSRSSRLIREH